MEKVLKLQSNGLSILIFLVLVSGAFFMLLYPIPFLAGVSFSLASIFFLLLLRLYGFKLAFLSSVLIYLFLVWFSGDTVVQFIFVLEVLVVGVIYKYMKTGNIIDFDFNGSICLHMLTLFSDSYTFQAFIPKWIKNGNTTAMTVK